MRLSKDVFLALASLQKREGASQLIEPHGLCRAATASLQGVELVEVTAAIEGKGAEGAHRAIDGRAMSESDRTLSYALATWFSQIGVVGTGEANPTYQSFLSARVLITFGGELNVPSDVCKRAMEATYRLACLPESERPAAYDLQTVASRLATQLFPTT